MHFPQLFYRIANMLCVNVERPGSGGFSNLHNTTTEVKWRLITANVGGKWNYYIAISANADKNIAQAKAEERRAMAIALEQEMKAKAQEARAKVIEAEAQIPIAIAEAFRTGNLGIMDYYRMQNMQADTTMREGIAKNPGNTDKK